jgi:hypothetical protein
MFRKLVLAIGATAVVGAAALAPTYVAGPDCYIVKRTVEWRDGSLHVRRYRVCN